MPIKKIDKIRSDYKKSEIDFKNLPKCPMKMFQSWLECALQYDEDSAICFVLSTVSEKQLPTSRVVLLRDITQDGFVFFTNYNSKKSRDIQINHFVSANFFWKDLEKQVRIFGEAHKISDLDSDKYFNSRPRKSQLGTWVSQQSSIIGFSEDLNSKIEEINKKFNKIDVPRPSYWGGYCIIPKQIEFWQGKPSRLHDRLLFCKEEEGWKRCRLSP